MARCPKAVREQAESVGEYRTPQHPEFTLPACCSVRPFTCCRYSTHRSDERKEHRRVTARAGRELPIRQSNFQIPASDVRDSPRRADIGGALR